MSIDQDKVAEFLQRPKVIVAGCVVLIAVFVTAWAISTYTTVRNEGRVQEQALSAQWKTMMASYGQFRLQVGDELSIAREKQAAIAAILADSVTGRYDRPEKDGQVDRQAVVSAIREAYPDLKGLDIFDAVLKDIQSGRERFGKDQAQIADQVRSYNDWRTTGSWLHPWFVRWSGFPSSMLEARIGDVVYCGQAALDKMSLVFVDRDTSKIFQSGTDKALSTN